MLTPQLIAAALRAAANVLDGGNVATNGAAPQPAPAPAPQPQYVAPQPAPAPAPQTPPPASNVTADQITALIQPHVANPAIKDALGVAMRSMGINALPEAQPHQYGALYQAFQNVIAQYTTAGAAPQAAPASII